MKARLIKTSWLGVITAALIVISAFNTQTDIHENHGELPYKDEKLKKEAFKILDTKCNVCHRKQNPFMVFNEKNISRRAKKIYQMVFVERRMLKGNEIQLTNEEFIKLKKWLFTENIL